MLQEKYKSFLQQKNEDTEEKIDLVLSTIKTIGLKILIKTIRVR